MRISDFNTSKSKKKKNLSYNPQYHLFFSRRESVSDVKVTISIICLINVELVAIKQSFVSVILRKLIFLHHFLIYIM